MISSVLLSTFLLGLVRAGVVPTAPGPGQVFKEGDQCTLSWALDTSGTWTSFNVDLMSGSNFAMQPVTNVFKGRDGRTGPTTYSWTCPQVTPNSAIYFYQFTQAGADTTWTTRFTIASPSGAVTPPANSIQPGGAAIPWGIGHLVGAGDNSATNNQTVTPPPTANTTALNTPSSNPSSTTGLTNSTVTNSTIAGNSSTLAPGQSTSSSNSAGQNPSTSTGNKFSGPNSSSSSSGSSTANPISDGSYLSRPKSWVVGSAVIAGFLVL